MKSTTIVLGVSLVLLSGVAIWQVTANQEEPIESESVQNTVVGELEEPIVPDEDTVPAIVQEEGEPVILSTREITLAEVQENNSLDACWVIIDGVVYDMTTYTPRHPGGIQEIADRCGTDGSAIFASIPNHQDFARDILRDLQVGVIAE